MLPGASDLVELAIDGLGSDGDGVGRLADGRVVFVPRALPGDRVRVRLGAARGRVQYGEMADLVEPSPQREPSRCEVEACGGCSLKTLSLDGHAEHKRQRLIETMRRIGRLDVRDRTAPLVSIGDGWRYRHRVRLHAEWARGRWQLGYHQRGSHAVVPLSHCPVLWPELETAATELSLHLAPLGHGVRLRAVEIAYSRVDATAAARVHVEGELERGAAWVEEIVAATGLQGLAVFGPSVRAQAGESILRYDHARQQAFTLAFEPGLFTQANPQVNDRLVTGVLQAVRPHFGIRVLEAHAGIGNFSLPMAAAGAVVIATESQARAVEFSRRNAAAAGLTLEHRVAVDADAAATCGDVDAMLLDPPRVGARAACEMLARMGPSRLVYVSCDPATLARDAAILVGGGYTLASLEPYDMFPRTAHVEALGVFERTP